MFHGIQINKWGRNKREVKLFVPNHISNQWKSLINAQFVFPFVFKNVPLNSYS